MTGIYRITNPKGKVYIGQSVNILKRFNHYQKIYNCEQQHRLYNSLIKYGYSAHIFEVVEECTVEELNVRERYWQDFYDVVSGRGLNCKLTGTEEKSGHQSQKTRENISTALRTFYTTAEGKAVRKRQVANTDKDKRARLTVENTDYKKRSKSYDWVSLHKKRVENTDYAAIAKKRWIEIEQYTKDGIFVTEWPSIKKAGEVLHIEKGSISGCCRGKYKSAGGFIWKYKNKYGKEEED